MHTVMRSVDKLKTGVAPATILCPLCSGYNDACTRFLNASRRRLSKDEIEAVMVAAAKGGCDSCDCGTAGSCSTTSVERFVCYACKKLLQEGIARNVPDFVMQRANAVAAAARSEGLRYALCVCYRAQSTNICRALGPRSRSTY